jgi:hypothetical protein
LASERIGSKPDYTPEPFPKASARSSQTDKEGDDEAGLRTEETTPEIE